MKYLVAFYMIIGLFLSGCSGSGGSAGSTATVSGVAATGAPVVGTIYLKDAAGHERSVATTNGSYSFNIAGLTAPFMLKAEWVVNSTTYTLFSSTPAAGTANINPFSNLIVAIAAGGADPAAIYATPGQFLSLSANLDSATSTLRNKLLPLLDRYQADINPINGDFAADHTGLDLLFDNIQVTLTTGAANISITDLNSGTVILNSAPSAIASAPAVQSWNNQAAISANDPDAAVDNNGRTIIVWSQQVSGIYNIIARGPVYDSTVTISNGINHAWLPKIAIDGSGNAVAVWMQSNSVNNYSEIWAARYDAVSGWGTARKISANANGGANVPQISVDSVGNALAVWHAQDTAINPNHFDVFSSRYNPASDIWSTPVIISGATNTAHNPHIAMNTSGNGIAVWTEGQDDGSTSNGPMDVWIRRYSLSGGWGGAAVKMNSIPGNVNPVYAQTAVAINQNSDAVVVWVQGGIWANSYTIANSWGGATLIANNPGISGNCYTPDVAMDGSGNAIAVWQQQDGISSAFAFANRFSGGVWGTSGKISDDSGMVFDTHVRMDNSGNAKAVWYQLDGDMINMLNIVPSIRSNTYSVGTGWGTASLVSTLLGIDGIMSYPVPRIGMNSTGASFTVWGVDSM